MSGLLEVWHGVGLGEGYCLGHVERFNLFGGSVVRKEEQGVRCHVKLGALFLSNPCIAGKISTKVSAVRDDH